MPTPGRLLQVKRPSWCEQITVGATDYPLMTSCTTIGTGRDRPGSLCRPLGESERSR